MAQDNVVIIGSLNDKELKNSIDALVRHVEAGTQKMATTFDNTIDAMRKKLQSLGNITVDMGGASDGGSSRRSKKNQDEAKSVRNLTISYDKLAAATQRAMQPKSAQDSFYTFLQSYREHAAALARELKQMPSASLDKQFAEYQRFESEIMRVQEQIRVLRAQLNEVGKNPNASRFEVKAITDEIGLLENKIRQLTSEQIANTRRIANEDNMALSQKKALYDNTLQIIREMTTVEKQGTTAILSQVDAQEQLNRKIQRQAEILRQDMMQRGSNSALWGSAVIYGNEKKYGTIEQQLVNAHRESLAATERRIAAEQREQQIKQETVNTTQQQLQVERSITDEQSKRTYKAPQTTFNQSFANMQANALGISRESIIGYTTDINTMIKRLQQLNQTWNVLTSQQRTSPFGLQLREEIQTTTRELEKLRNQASRPINLQSVLGLSAKTLDEIAYKIRMLQSYRNGLDLKKQANEVKRTTQEIDRLQKKQNEVIGTTRRWAKENDAVSRSFEYIKNRIAFMFTVGAATNFVKQIYEIRGQYELLERSIGILVDSLQQGSQIFAELNAMAIKSPFTAMELGAAAKQLTAYDIAAKDVVDTTKRLADMAAAVGVPIERLTYALGQIKAYGYLNARDARMFANAGIPLVQELADRYTELEGRLVSVGDVYDRIKKKAISFEDVLDVINNVTDEGGRFFNFQEKAADTLKVKLANLTLAWNNMLNEIGKSNQSLLTMPLSALKTLYEHWRDLNNIIMAVAVSFGVVKLAQIAYYVWMRNAALATAAHVAIGGKFVQTLTAMKASLVGFATNPFAMAIAGLTLMGTLLAKAVFDYMDLQQANEDFNRSIANNADENIKSIDKFFDEYKKQLDGIGGENAAAQQKMWERLREEIEKASKTAQTYLQILNNIGDVSKRISAGREVLEQIQEINKEAKNLAERELFSIGGGFANDSLAKNLREYEQQFNELIKDYGSLKNAAKDAASETAAAGMGISFHSWWNYLDILKEAERELDKFSSVLDNANLEKVMGDGTPESQLANIREFTSIIRDGFLATEQGQKVSASGRALLNKRLDEWIANQAVANKLIDEERATIERNRTAWETFFDQLSKKDKERLDYMVATNQTGSKAFQDIWDKATKNMIENANTSYLQIQDQISDLRNTPDIVIKVVYRETKEKLDEQQEEFQRDFLTPKGKSVLSPEKYFEERKKLTEKYAHFQKKEGEDNVEWEKRLGDEYRKNKESIKRLNAQLRESANLSEVDRKAKEHERDTLVDQNKVLDEIRNKQNFDYSKKTKGGRTEKDIVAEAIKQELSIIKEMRSNYDKLRKAGVSDTDALKLSAQGYELTLERVNNVLQKFGISKFNASDFAGKNVRQLLDSLTKQRDTLIASGKVKTSSLKDLEVEIQKLTIDAKTYDMKMITDGLNSELGKLKDEYELAVELDANPELGNMFLDMFNIDASDFPKTIDEYMSRVQQEFDNARKKLNLDVHLNIFKAGAKEWEEWGKQVGLVVDVLDENGNVIGKNTDALDKITPKFKEAQGVAKKWAQDTVKSIQDLEYKLGDINKKIEIENTKLKKLEDQAANETNARLKHLLELRIQEQKEAIEKLKMESIKLLPFYENLFGDMYNVSVRKLKEIAKAAKEVMSPRKGNNGVGYTQRTDSKGKVVYDIFAKDKQGQIKKTTISLEEYIKINKQIDSVQQKIAESSPWEKIKDSFSKKEGGGLKNFASGMEAIGGEMQKVANITKEIGGFAEALGADENTVETINDIATSIGGVATAAQGIGQIASGDYIGGAASVLSGVTSVIETWMDNSGKKIDREIKNSELAVKRLENAYKDLERAIKDAFGTAQIGARQTAISNKKLQLAELNRQLQLENSKSSKKRDAGRIADLQGQIIDLRNEIEDMRRDITNSFLGISSVSDAVDSMMGGIIDSLRNGEDAMQGFNDSIDNMIANMIKQVFSARILGPMVEDIWNKIDSDLGKRGEIWSNELAKLKKELTNIETMTNDTGDGFYFWKDEKGNLSWQDFLNPFEATIKQEQGLTLISYKEWKEIMKGYIAEAEQLLKEATTPTMDDVRRFAEDAKGASPALQEYIDYFESILEEFNLIKKSDENLSKLQQGIQGVTEDTAGAIEAYMNSVSQQVYLQSDILTQIRDTILGFELDAQVATLSQMLLQLQQSYVVQQNIENLLQNVINPSGRAFMVELAS